MKTKIIYITILIILICSLFLGLGDKILYAKSGIERSIPVVFIFFGIPFCVYKIAFEFTTSKKSLSIMAISILILGPVFGIWSKYLSEKDFNLYGKITYGIVNHREWTSTNNRGRWTISARFEYNSIQYETFSKDDNDNNYKLNDKIKVRFSTRNPENNEILIE